MSRATVEDAITAAVRAASGLNAQRVIWSSQNGNRPSTPFVTLHLNGPRVIGVEKPEYSYDSGASAGEEIEVSVGGMREYSLSVQVFGDNETGNSSSSALAMAIQAKLQLPSTRALLHAVGASCFDVGTVQSIPAILNAGFEARAQFDARLYVYETVSERTTYIETVEVTTAEESEADLGDLTVDLGG